LKFQKAFGNALRIMSSLVLKNVELVMLKFLFFKSVFYRKSLAILT